MNDTVNNSVSLTLVPPSPFTDKIVLDIRGSVRNNKDTDQKYSLGLYLDNVDESSELLSEQFVLPAGATRGIEYRWPTVGHAGEHTIYMMVCDGSNEYSVKKEVRVLESDQRSLNRIHGTWSSILHWSPDESRLFNDDMQKMTDDDWREMVRGMHELGMDTVVIQEVFRNQMYVGQHNIPNDGYHGKAFYPSKLYPGRIEMTAKDPIEAILSEADKLGMHVFPGVGLYAWFDFSQGSLQWHKEVTQELLDMYGHHESFYGWYISEEVCGNLGENDSRRQDIVDFFREFKTFARELTPDKPIMLAPNCHGIHEGYEYWPKLLESLDILCPFGFHRMPPADITGEEAADLLQRLCDDSQCHLWMDMEIFLFAEDTALYPRPIDGVISDMQRFPNFEKILCYQYPGLMNSACARIQPGGSDTLKLFKDYKNFINTTSETQKLVLT